MKKLKMALQSLATIVLAALAGWAYRFGGSANGQRWVREVGVGIAELLCLWTWYGFNWLLILIMGSVWIETTYFKRKGTDAKWYNWLCVGLSYSVVPLPYMFSGQCGWLGFGVRAVVVTVFTTLWRTFNGNANSQEIGCGIVQIITIPFLLLV